MRLFLLAAMLCLAFTSTTFAYTRYCAPEASQTIVKLPVTSEKSTITSPDWIQAEVTSGVEVETNKPVSIVILLYASTTTYRRGKIVINFPSQTITINVFQAAPLSFVRNGNEVITHNCTEAEMPKAWFVPDDGVVLPDLIYSRTDDNGVIVAVPPSRGQIFIETAKGLFAAKL